MKSHSIFHLSMAIKLVEMDVTFPTKQIEDCDWVKGDVSDLAKIYNW